MPDRDLDGKVAIVTGAAMGMGEATARLFAAARAHVLVSDINAEAGEATAQSICQDGGSASFCRVDVSRAADAEAMVRMAVERYGRLDCAVNNAALTPDTHPIAELDEDEFDRILSVDLKGVALCLKYEIAQMLEQGDGGAIVNIGSVSSFRPQPENAAYVAAKHGVIGLTKVAALDYGAKGVRVNAICPGTVHSAMVERYVVPHPELHQHLIDIHPIGRLGRAEEVAAAAVWLCTDAASFVLGAALPVDGGYVLP
jgi:glucose 1-dehydrogenase